MSSSVPNYRPCAIKKAELCKTLDSDIPIMPSDLTQIIADYAVLLDVYFTSKFPEALSKDNKTVTIPPGEEDYTSDTVVKTQYPLCMIPSKFTFRIDSLTPRSDSSNYSLSIGIVKFDADGNISDCRDIQSCMPNFVRDASKLCHKYCNDKKIVFIEGTTITFHTNIVAGTITLEIDGKKFEDAINGISYLGEWIPYIDCWTYPTEIKVSVY